eukprot:s916_g23.t1
MVIQQVAKFVAVQTQKMATAVSAAKEFISGPRVVQAASKLLEACPLPQLCEALTAAKREDAEPLVAALEGLSEIEEVRTLFLEEGVTDFLTQGASAPDARLRLTVAKLLVHLAHGEASVQKLLDAGLFNLCEPLLLDEETAVAETAAKAVCAGVGCPAGQQALLSSPGSLTDVLLRRLPDLPVQRIRVLALFVQLGRAGPECFSSLEQKGAFEKVLGSFLTDDLLLKLNAVELMDADLSSSDNDDILCLAIQFQGLEVTVRGPSERALEFVERIQPGGLRGGGPANPPAPRASASGSPAPLPDCPDNLLALSARLSAASFLSPADRVKRAWTLGCRAKRLLDGQEFPDEPIISCDLPSNFFVVLRGVNISEPKILRSARAFHQALEGAELPGVGHDFPSETEARVYLAAAGRSSLGR